MSDQTARLRAVVFAVPDPREVARFWATLLGREVAGHADEPLLAGDEGQVGLRFVAGPSHGAGPNLLHLHLASAGDRDQERTVARALGLGARHLDVGQRPEEGHVVLADPAGDEFCVIPHTSVFLAGCGFLAEVACDGTRAVGRFWSDALGWPLVWDQDDETAVQSPSGGTKVAWGGPPLSHREGPARQWFELTTSDAVAAASRLSTLGAGRPGRSDPTDGTNVLADPDGNPFRLVPTR